MTDEAQESGNMDVADEVETTPTDVSLDKSDADIEPSSEPKKFKVKIAGKDKEVTEDELIRDYQLKEHSYEKLQEASKLSKDAKSYLYVMDALKKGDLSVLKQLGVSQEARLKYSEEEILAHLEHEDKSPEEKRALKAERELETIKGETAKTQQAQLAQQAAQEIESDIVEALKEIDVPLKGNYRLVRRMAEDMFAALEAKLPKVNAKTARDRVQKSMREDFSEHISREYGKDPEKFIESLPASFVDDVRKRDLKKVKSQLPIGGMAGNETSIKPRKTDEFRKYQMEEFAKRG